MQGELRVLLYAPSRGSSDATAAALRAGTPDLHTEVLVTASAELVKTACSEGGWDLLVVDAAGAELGILDGLNHAAHPFPIMIVTSRPDESLIGRAFSIGATLCLHAHFAACLPEALQRVATGQTARRQHEQSARFDQEQRDVLECIARAAPLPEVLERIALTVEHQDQELMCSIVLLDREHGCIRHGAAPSLPDEYNRALDGQKISPTAGSCGAAAVLGQRVIVSDIATHPNWAPYRHLALPYGLRACWSTPIFAATGEVLGTFAIYHREPRNPTAQELGWVDAATHLASIAIMRNQAEQALIRSEARYKQIVDTTREGIWMLDADARILFVNKRMAEMLGHEPCELIGKSAYELVRPSDRRSYAEMLARRKIETYEPHDFCFVRRDGSEIWTIVTASPAYDEERRIVGTLAMMTDITARKLAEDALAEREAEIRATLDQAAIGIALVGIDGHVRNCNKALEAFVGYTLPELCAMSFKYFTHPDDVEQDVLQMRAVIAGRIDRYQIEKRYVRQDGKTVWGRLSVSPVKRGDEPVRHIIAVVEDITDRKELEETVRSSERLRTLIYESAADTIFFLGVEPGERFRVLSVNAAFERTTGLSKDYVVGKLVDEVFCEPTRSLVKDHYLKAMRERRIVRWEEVADLPIGRRYSEVAVSPIIDQSGQCTSLVGTAHDVTELRQTQEKIAAQAALLDQAKDAIIACDARGIVTYWSEGARKIYGWTSEEAKGREVTSLMYAGCTAVVEARRVLFTSGQWSGDLTLVTKSGAQLIVEANWTLVRDGTGEPKAILAIESDATERKSLETQVLIAQRMESLGTLAGGIAHDFNNILMAIIGNAEIAMHLVTPEHRAYKRLVEIDKASARARDLVRQILSVSHHAEQKCQVVSLSEVADEALRLLRATFPAMIEINSHVDPSTPKINADPTQIHQIVMNLGTNAAHAMEASGGTIDVRVEGVTVGPEIARLSRDLSVGYYARLTVADNGVGMDEATLLRVFEPFFTTKAQGKGTGLGLSVVHGIVKRHHAAIFVNSAPARGTTFQIYFPAASELAADVPSNAGNQLHGHGEHVLFIDDEEALLTLYTELLEARGFRVTGFRDPLHGLRAFTSSPQQFDAVVTDYAMPSLSGSELAREVHKLSPDLPIVMISGYLEREESARARHFGVRRFLHKPASLDDLVSTLIDVLPRRAARSEDDARLGT